MKLLIAALGLACILTGCFATAGDLEGAVADITGRIDVVARDAQQSSEAAREAWKRGEITYAEMQQRLQDVRAATLDQSKEITREVIDGVKETIATRPEVIADGAADVSRTMIPGPFGEILALLIASGGTYLAASKRAQAEASRMSMERDIARMERGEPVGHKRKTQ